MYVFTARLFRQPVLPRSGEIGSYDGACQVVLDRESGRSRYIGLSNFLRAVLYVPFLVMFLLHDGRWQFWLYFAMGVCHLALTMVETYKAALLSMAKPGAEEGKSNEITVEPWADWYFAPKKFETEKYFTRLGMEWFRTLVLTYTNWAMLNRSQRKSGRKLEFVSRPTPQEVLRFDLESRYAELSHTVLLAIDMVFVTFTIVHRVWWIMPYSLWVLWGECSLVFLQRYHRARMWRSVVRARRKTAALEGAG